MTLTPSLALTVACFSIATAFVGTGFSIGGTIVAEIAPAEHRGSAQGILVGVASFGGIIAPPLAGAVIQAAGRQLAIGFNSVFLLTGGIVLVTAVLFLLAVRPERKSLVANLKDLEGVVPCCHEPHGSSHGTSCGGLGEYIGSMMGGMFLEKKERMRWILD